MQAGKPLSCRADVDGGKTTLTYTFKNHMELRGLIDPAIDAMTDLFITWLEQHP